MYHANIYEKSTIIKLIPMIFITEHKIVLLGKLIYDGLK